MSDNWYSAGHRVKSLCTNVHGFFSTSGKLYLYFYTEWVVIDPKNSYSVMKCDEHDDGSYTRAYESLPLDFEVIDLDNSDFDNLYYRYY